TSNNQETVLYRFQGGGDGANPLAGLLMDGAGNLFGTTSQGGGCLNVCGTIFMIDTFNNESVLYSFTGGGDGGNPTSSLVMDAKGNLYGTTSLGGAGGGCAGRGCGSVFEFPFDDNA